MKLLATIKPEDVDSDAPRFDYGTFTLRQAVRAVIFDGNRVALLHVGKHGYYMLPGGGIDVGEDPLTALAREIHEELGAEISVISEVGIATIYNDYWAQQQTDLCYVAQLVKNGSNLAQTDNEIEEGHKPIWTDSLSNAIRLVREAVPNNREGKILKARDLLLLNAARDVIEAVPT